MARGEQNVPLRAAAARCTRVHARACSAQVCYLLLKCNYADNQHVQENKNYYVGPGARTRAEWRLGEEGLRPERQLAALRWLVRHGADVEATRADGTNALLAAVGAGRAQAVRCLLREAGAVADAALPDGRSALELAVGLGDVASVRELLSARATVQPKAREAALARREHELTGLVGAILTEQELCPVGDLRKKV